ncbi:MAG TPA: TonB-dependent receptor [Allosphingosinicella sp.]|jgi:outer membrane receptor protein involved in Fe transport|nr:TonB-dependent receptor [Allosphingosinicella sp.]
MASTLIFGTATFASPAWAQPVDDETQENAASPVADPTQSSGQNVNQVDEDIFVTGSRIRRPDLTSSSPLTVVQDEEFSLSGTVNVEQVINTLPQVIPGSTSFSNNPGGGVATLNLRGLGEQRNLVLVNGRRYIFYDASQIVDLNTIPAFLIDSVDVVTGGASAVYGSDALVGVVNFRLRTDLEGITAGAQYNITEEGDGRRYNGYVAIGSQMADGRGHVAAYAEYYNRGSIFQGDRAFSRFALSDNATSTGLQPGGSAGVPQGRFTAASTLAIGTNGNCSAANGPIVDCATIAAGTNFTGLGAFFFEPGRQRAFVSGPDSYNYAPSNYLMVPQERWTLGGYAEYEVVENVNAYTEVAFINNRVQNELAPTPITQNINFNIATACTQVDAATCATLQQIGANQQAAIALAAARGAANPFGVNGSGAGQIAALQPGQVRLQANTRTAAISNRNSSDDRNAFRALVGLRGNVSEDLTYDAYYMFARTRNSNIQIGNISRSRFITNVQNGTCNIFGADQLSDACRNNIGITAQNTEISQLQVAQASIAGSLFTTPWANDAIGFATGVEWRSMSASFIPDTALSSGDVAGFNAGQPTAGGYNVKEVFGEVRIPLVQDSLFHRFEVTGAARYSDYSLDAVGGVYTYAVGAEFAPVRDITFRGQYQRAVRAPNVQELFGGQSVGFPAATDPCSNRNTTQRTEIVRALCIAQGVPQSAVFTQGIQPNDQIQGAFGGNPNLEEEVGDTYTAGVVLRPRFIPRLNIAVDYYDIRIDNAIATAGGGVANILNLCFFTIQNANSAICQLISRDPSGVISGPPNVVSANNANLSSITTKGIDFQVDYTQPLGFSMTGAGESRLNFFFLGNYSWENNFTPLVDLPDEVDECAGRFGQLCGDPTPRWKWSSRLSLIDGPVTTSVRWRHVGRTRDEGGFFVDTIGAYDLFDLSFSVNAGDHMTLNFGVNNLFDKNPPIIGSNQEQANTFPGTFDVLGRDFFVSANVRF